MAQSGSKVHVGGREVKKEGCDSYLEGGEETGGKRKEHKV